MKSPSSFVQLGRNVKSDSSIGRDIYRQTQMLFAIGQFWIFLKNIIILYQTDRYFFLEGCWIAK